MRKDDKNHKNRLIKQHFVTAFWCLYRTKQKQNRKSNKAIIYVWAEHSMLTFDAYITPLSGAFSSKPINAFSGVYFCAIFIQAIVYCFFPVPFCENRFLIQLIKPNPSRGVSWITTKPYPGPLR